VGGVGWNIPDLDGLLNEMETPVIPLMVLIPSLYLHVTQTPHFVMAVILYKTLKT